MKLASLLTEIETQQQWSLSRQYQRGNDYIYRIEFHESVYVNSWERARELRELTWGNIYCHINGSEKLV